MTGPGHIDLDNPGDCKAYADLYERENKEKVSLERQVRALHDQWIAPTVHQETLRQLYAMEQERNDYKARLEGMLSKADPGHPDGNGRPWARAENGEVSFGLLEDGSDDESYDIEMAESMASSLWRAAREARSQDHVVPPPPPPTKVPWLDPRHRAYPAHCICCHCNGHEVVSASANPDDIGKCRICKRTQEEIDGDA